MIGPSAAGASSTQTQAGKNQPHGLVHLDCNGASITKHSIYNLFYLYVRYMMYYIILYYIILYQLVASSTEFDISGMKPRANPWNWTSKVSTIGHLLESHGNGKSPKKNHGCRFGGFVRENHGTELLVDFPLAIGQKRHRVSQATDVRWISMVHPTRTGHRWIHPV